MLLRNFLKFAKKSRKPLGKFKQEFDDFSEKANYAERLGLSMDMAEVGSWELNLNTLQAKRTLRHDQIFGYDIFLPEWSYPIFLEHIYPDDRSYVEAEFKKALKAGKPWDFECRIIRNDGEIRWIWFKGNTIYKDNEPESILGIVSDITKRKVVEEQIKTSMQDKEVLLSEIHHRVKNSLALISGILSIQATKMEDLQYKRIFEECINRIRTISMIHETLYQNADFSIVDFKSYISKLIGLIKASYEGIESPDIDFKICSGDFFLNLTQAVPCGLIVNELIMNACKHAFTDREKGEILLSLTQTGDVYEIKVSDNGKGLPEGADLNETFGFTIIYGLIKQLKATLEIERKNGTAFTICFHK